MTEDGKSIYPEPFEPSPPEGGIVSRLGWFFSAAGRARLRLLKAFACSEDAGRRNAVADVVPALLDKAKRGDFQAIDVAEEALVFLVWSGMRCGDYADAGRWLADLQRSYPSLTERIRMRWELMTLMLSAGDHDHYVEQAKAFLADSLMSRGEYTGPVLDTIAAVYERVSPSECEAVVSVAHDGISRSRNLQAALALCRCPSRFESAERAAAAASGADPECLGFSSIMRADAFIVAARAREWSSDFEGMAACAGKALEAAPGYGRAAYWVLRSGFYREGDDSCGCMDVESIPDSPERDRLLSLMRLRGEPSFERAEAAVLLFVKDCESLDFTESGLFLKLLSTVLTADMLWPLDRVSECARLCGMLEGCVGGTPWVQFGIALAEVRVDRAYSAAIERLEKQDIVSWGGAGILARIARIFVCSPPQQAGSDAVGTVESALFSLLRDAGSADFSAVREGLSSVREDALCTGFPLLGEVAGLLDYAMSVVGSGDTGAGCELSENALPWMRWLRGRLALLQSRGDMSGLSPDCFDCDLPALCWCVESWWYLYGSPGVAAPDFVLECSGRIDGLLHGDAVRAEDSADEIAFIRGLGPLCDALMESELVFEREFRSVKGSKGDPEGLVDRVGELPRLAAAWWRPAFDYYRGVFLAAAGSGDARSVLEGLMDGPCACQARTQAALLSIQGGDLSGAEELLSGVEVDFPAFIYAKALLAERRGEDAVCRGLLDSYESLFGSVTSPYSTAVKRLSAAVEERAGNETEAERLNREVVAGDPNDSIASARLSRILLRRVYGAVDSDGELDGDDPGLLFEIALRDGGIGWCVPLHRLYKLLTAQSDDIACLRDEVVSSVPRVETVLPLLQVGAYRLLSAGRPAEALGMVERDASSPMGRSYRKTLSVLRAWSLLSNVWSCYKEPDQASVREEVERLRSSGCDDENVWEVAETALREKAVHASISWDTLGDMDACARDMTDLIDEDPFVRGWKCLLEKAVEIGKTGVLDCDWGVLSESCLSYLPAIWSDDPDVRSTAASNLGPSVEAAALNWDDHQAALLRALCAWVSGDDEGFLDCYSRLEPVIENLPVDGPSLWFGAASIWFGNKSWGQLLEGKMPDCVADLSNPQVRLLIGLAYAQSAADDGLKKSREALVKIRQARNALEPLLAESGQRSV